MDKQQGEGQDVNAVFGADAAAEDQEPAQAAPAAESAEVVAMRAEMAAMKQMIADLLREREEKIERDSNLSQAASKRRMRIVISESHGGADPARVFVGVNGRGYDIQRNIEVDVPAEVVGVLENAVAGRAVPKVNEKGIVAGVDFIPGQRFPFRVVGEAVDINGVRKLPELPYQITPRLV